QELGVEGGDEAGAVEVARAVGRAGDAQVFGGAGVVEAGDGEAGGPGEPQAQAVGRHRPGDGAAGDLVDLVHDLPERGEPVEVDVVVGAAGGDAEVGDAGLVADAVAVVQRREDGGLADGVDLRADDLV